MLYIVQRDDCHVLSLAQSYDPYYKICAKEARKKGVEFMAYDCLVSPNKIILNKKMSIEF